MEANLQHAIELYTAGKLEEAREQLLQLVTANPKHPQTLYYTASVHDSLGLEHEAEPYYRAALDNGLTGSERAEAFLGLGSTYRALGEYQQAVETLQQGVQEFPQQRALQVFLAMALYNVQRHAEAMELVLRIIAETSSNEDIQTYRRAILFYAPQLNQVWEA
ncbi:tetratricopeptide repeat protein [Thermosporothrix hazakensis]|jgi:tetratricopeptide (TPR) repeat protein|uniref:Tetratricopeptide repeat protein n=1 Tax=Thermosporothrix hazakensis TaxID=644383 RepID=A0A326UER0_THEHA|nr:tetratricopeptide repeat protein [Thermosporothrix hazakensis]PZW36786.1 tetratricopeptide repeat protein [Thermosporothrix hazakensis]GCE47435.1 hypothetical protein KTH_23040 [Thermosporothrix hazakensis]